MSATRSARHLACRSRRHPAARLEAARLEAAGCAGATGSQDGCHYDAAHPIFIVCGAACGTLSDLEMAAEQQRT